jgi:hypothetical protein
VLSGRAATTPSPSPESPPPLSTLWRLSSRSRLAGLGSTRSSWSSESGAGRTTLASVASVGGAPLSWDQCDAFQDIFDENKKKLLTQIASIEVHTNHIVFLRKLHRLLESILRNSRDLVIKLK